MAEADKYSTVKAVSYGFYREKGSRFVSAAHPVKNENEIKLIIESVRQEHHEARHHCYAWAMGVEADKWRANDDGEPSGTAGRPILGQIRSYGLTNVLIIVSRYFGGTLLGVSGLINAYRTAAAIALENADIIEHYVCESYELTFPYQSINDVMKIIKEENIDQSDHSFDLECIINISFRSSSRQKILTRFSRIESLNYKFLEKA
ncbi:MAG TPA: YigZ family protein [Bacteroidales bacterium]|nr:YigZ family protein [Bacteroidales bacterium]